MDLYNIKIQFPNISIKGHCELMSYSFENGLITKFLKFNEENKFNKSLQTLLVEFYKFGAEYFENSKLSGEDVAKKLEKQLGEIWLDTTYHFIGCWPHSVNFGELCFSSDPTVDLEITWKYKTFHPMS